MQNNIQEEDDKLGAQLFALRTGLIMLAASLADRLPDDELRKRLERCADEADMRGGELRFSEASELLRTMASNLSLPGPAATDQ